jgi:hypothetical protein
MLVYKSPNASGSTISVTTTATTIFDLVNTAAGTDLVNAGFPHGVNSIDIKVEDGDIRWLDDGNTPTSSAGFLLASGDVAFLRDINMKTLQLVSTTGTVSCSVRVGINDREDVSAITGGGSAAGNEDIISTVATYTSVSMSLADTEYTYTLPSAAKSIEMRLDIDSTSDFKLNIGGGVGDSATDYIPVEDGELYWRQNLNLAGGTVLRFQSPSAGETMRIVTFA